MWLLEGAIYGHAIADAQHIPILTTPTLKRFVSWVDLSLVVNENILLLLFYFVASAEHGSQDDTEYLPLQLTVQALKYLQEIANRGMEDGTKNTAYNGAETCRRSIR